MKKLLLILLVLNSFYSRAVDIQINFVDGYSIYVTNNYPLSPSEGSSTTDSNINLIFSNHAVNHCYQSSNIIFASYPGSDLNSFITDLENNNNVSRVRVCPSEYVFADRLYIKLYNVTNGNPIGMNANGNITTTNSNLNIIFENHQVKIMSGSIQSYYEIYFDGVINQLYADLTNLNTVIELVENVGVALLENEKFNKNKPLIFPNPFSNNFNIETQESITAYSIFDITGKQIISTSSKIELDNQASKLQTGMYVLNLVFENGLTANSKLVKK